MFKSKKILALLLAVLMLTAIFAGCGSSAPAPSSQASGAAAPAETNNAAEPTPASEETINLTMWTLQGRAEAFDPLTKEFNEANPNINVTVSYYDTDGIKNACKVAASSNALPDMWFNWGGSLGGFYVDNGLTYDMTAYAKDNGWDNIFSGGVLSLCTFDGKLSGYPTGYNVIPVYYRKDIFDQFGLTPPTTFEEFEKVCDTLVQNGITPMSTTGMYGWHVMRVVEQLIEHYAGAELHDKMNTFQESYNNEAVVQALTKYKEFCDKGYFPQGFVTIDTNDTKLPVYQGTAAMVMEGQWNDGLIITDEQDISKYGVFAFPSVGTNRMSAFGEMTQINANLSEAQVAACVKFNDYVYSNEAVDRYGEYYSRPLPRLDATMPAGQPNVPIALDTSNKNGTFTITDQAFPTEIADALFNVQDAIANNQMQPAEGAVKIQEAIEAYHNK